MRTFELYSWLFLLLVPQLASPQTLKLTKSGTNISKYVNEEHHLSFEYPTSWVVMKPDEVAQKTKQQLNTKDAIVFVTFERDFDRNVNIKAVEIPTSNNPSISELKEFEGALDRQYPRRFSGFNKVSSRVFMISGVNALEYVLDIVRIDKPFRQKQVLLDKNRRSYILTFTAQRESYEKADKDCFQVIISTLEIH